MVALAGIAAFAVVIASALIRHMQSGLSCVEWPACYGSAAAMRAADATPLVHGARIAHRIAASVVLVASLGMAFTAWRRRRNMRRELRVAVLASLVAIFLAVLGASMAGSVLPAYGLANLTGGFVLVAIFAAAWRVSARGAAPADATRRMAIMALVLLLLQTELGGLLGVQHALTTCARLGECEPSWRSTVQSGALDLFRRPAWTDGGSLVSGAAATLHFAHRALGAVLAVVALLLAASLDGPFRPLRWVVGVLITTALILGFAAATLAGPLAFVVLHNAVAALLAALFTWLATPPPAP